MTATQLVTAEEFYEMGSDAPYELIDGMLIDAPLSGWKSGVVGARMVCAVFGFVDAWGLGYVTGASGGYILSREPDTVVAPSGGFLRGSYFPHGLPDRGFSPVPPDLAVEVLSPATGKPGIVEKQPLYRRAGVPLVWWVDPEREIVTVYRLGHDPKVGEATGALDGGDVLPGLELKLSEIFRD